jgi:hypothetical protein
VAKKKSISQQDIIDFYMDYVLMHDYKPSSVYAFAKSNNFVEQKFYEFFSSFESLEQSIFKIFFDHTITTLDKSEDYHSFNTRNKLLSFYYTFFEILTVNRSYVVKILEGNKNHLKSLKTFAHLKQRFSNYIEYLDIKTIDLKQEQLTKLQSRALKESAWLQLLVTMKFWLDDESTSFEKTDVFIEKSVKASFDLIDTTPLKSFIDFGKFLYKERMQTS